jgi:murein DD-endopeptidase MepM/ murein hydrolase activator NlpD
MKHIPLKRYFLAIAILFIITLSCNWGGRKTHAPVEEAEVSKDTVYPLGFCTDSFFRADGKVPEGATFSGLMGGLGLSGEDTYKLIQASDSIFDVRKFRAGNTWQAYYSDSTTLRYLVYQDSRVRSIVFQCKDSLAAWAYDRPVIRQEKVADVTIHSSLWNDMLDAGASPLLIVELADIYAWTVDFFGLQEGDRFRLLYHQDVCEGEVFRIVDVEYAVFSRGEKDAHALFFDQQDGGNKYWNEKGESMRKAFLKAPLKFSRISSGFTYHRVHPVHGVVRPHTAIDYAAPTGTPVMSIGDGTVISKGWAGGGGNTVKVRHNSVYTTSYMHLSKYTSGLKVGDRVHQGQVIGYVGMTGTATGPHLDFRVYKNGTPINPLTMEAPSGDPIQEQYKSALDSLYQLRSHKLDSLLTLPQVL